MNKNPTMAESQKTAARALELMEQHHIAPLPENFAVWYHYARGDNKALVQEVDNLVSAALPFSDTTSSYLHTKFIAPHAGQKALDEAASSGEKALIEALKVINDFSDETKSYSKSVDEYLENISQKFEDENVKAVVKNLINATVTMKESGKKLSKKLEESTNEINTLKKDLEKVTVESQRDFLTHVFNRKTFEKYADEQMAAAKQAGADLCLLMIDIDHFKSFNDRYGHLIGDEVLKTVAKTLVNILKGQDMVARFGGEEFIVILPATRIEGATIVAETIRSTIASKELKRKDTHESFGTITVSMGIAKYRAESDNLPLLIKRADDALYQSKNNGRNRVTCES